MLRDPAPERWRRAQERRVVEALVEDPEPVHLATIEMADDPARLLEDRGRGDVVP